MNPERARPVRPGAPGRLGAYEVIGFLGEGGMGVVHLGRGPGGEQVAIKVVRAEFARQPEFRARFRREAESAMRVPRFCTAEVLAADPDAAEPYLVTEYIDGPTLEQVVRAGGPLRGAELDQLAVSMAAALTGIHAAGVTHRDLKPANVLLSRMGPRVIDFGIANAVDSMRLTAEGQTLGTPSFMAPEQLDGRAGPASDVFAWGGVMVFAATGRRPFGTGPLPELAARVMHGEPDLRGVSGPLRAVIEAALTKDERLRPTPGRLLQWMGVSGADPAVAVQTRLADMGLADPAAPPSMVETRHDARPGGARAGEARAAEARAGEARAAEARAGGAAGAEAEAASLRFGPGVGAEQPAAPDEATRIWRSGNRPSGRAGGKRADAARSGSGAGRSTGRRVRSSVSALLGLAVFAGLAAWLILQNRHGDLQVTGVKVAAVKQRSTCGNVDLTGMVTTNGEPGTLTYQWRLSDKKRPEPAARIDVAEGNRSVTLPFRWQFSGRSRGARYTATLTVGGVAQPGLADSAAFTYSCLR